METQRVWHCVHIFHEDDGRLRITPLGAVRLDEERPIDEFGMAEDVPGLGPALLRGLVEIEYRANDEEDDNSDHIEIYWQGARLICSYRLAEALMNGQGYAPVRLLLVVSAETHADWTALSASDACDAADDEDAIDSLDVH